MTKYENDNEVLCDTCGDVIPEWTLGDLGYALTIPNKPQNLHVCESCRIPSALFGYNPPRHGAEYWGTVIEGKPSKLTTRCTDWEPDQAYMDPKQTTAENPKDCQDYIDSIVKNGRQCIMCLWNDGDECVHKKVEDAKNE